MAHEHKHDANGAGYEVEDASIREVVFTGIGLAVGTIIVCFAVYGLLRVMNTMDAKDRTPLTQIPTQEVFPPSPRLQEKPWEELQVLRSQENQKLTTYGWVDKNSGRVRIPVDRAMELVLQKGLPARAGGDGTGGQPNAPKK